LNIPENAAWLYNPEFEEEEKKKKLNLDEVTKFTILGVSKTYIKQV
jgi:hypothetical protein